MPNTTWKNGRKFSFPVRDRHGNNINFRLKCQPDKGNKRFVLRWQNPSVLNPITGKKKSEYKNFETYEEAFQYIKNFEFKEDQRNSGAKQRLTFLSDEQLRDAEMAISLLPNDLSLKVVAESYLAELPNKEATINEVYQEWIQEAERANKRSSTISSRKDTTREFRKLYGTKKAHKVTFKDVEAIVFKNLKNGNKPSSQTIKNRWSGIRALMNRAISKGYLRKDGNPCETYNGFSELPSSTPNKNFLTVSQTQALIKNATEYKEGIMLAYFSLACFSGLRPHEIHGDAFRSPKDCDPLTWNDIDLDSDNPEIFVSEEQAKTRLTRWAPLGEHNINLRILLNYAKELGHDLITTKNFKENWRAVVKLSELSFEGSDADSPRRSFASYLHNKNRTIADKELSRIMGNSPYVLNKHYKTIIQSGEGTKYFRIGPSGLLLDENQLLTAKDREIKRLQNFWKSNLDSYAKKASLDF
jgi:integrase